jgi:ATP-dependent RNA circularization protein (DNA/RNA ligase family)
MSEYPKIETLFNRGDDFKVITDALRKEEFSLINRWHLTEKVDGTNIRLIVKPNEITVGGRTANAQIHAGLLTACMNLFDGITDWYDAHFDENDDVECVLYGEGYGPKIQSGGGYRADQGFRLFDVTIGGKFLDWPKVEEVAHEAGLQTVPFLGYINRNAVVDFVSDLNESITAKLDGGTGVVPEGVVARTVPYLYDWRGDRIMWKLKKKDF